MPLHAHMQALGTLQDLPRRKRREGGAIDPQHLHARPHGEGKIAKGLVKLDAVVARRGLGHTGKLAVVPGKLAALHQHPAQRGAMAAQILGGRVHHDVSPMKQRPA